MKKIFRCLQQDAEEIDVLILNSALANQYYRLFLKFVRNFTQEKKSIFLNQTGDWFADLAGDGMKQKLADIEFM